METKVKFMLVCIECKREVRWCNKCGDAFLEGDTIHCYLGGHYCDSPNCTPKG